MRSSSNLSKPDSHLGESRPWKCLIYGSFGLICFLAVGIFLSGVARNYDVYYRQKVAVEKKLADEQRARELALAKRAKKPATKHAGPSRTVAAKGD